MPPDRRLRSASPPTQSEQVPDLREAVKVALGDMKWLSPSDQALVVLAMRIADEIETAVERARDYADLLRDAAASKDPSIYKRVEKLESQCNAVKAVGWLGQQLQGVLRDLGGTPGARRAMGTEKLVGGRLAQIRKDAAARQDHS